MSEEKKLQQEVKNEAVSRDPEKVEISPTWAHECIEDLDDWIESQGIYLRQ